MKKPLLVPSLLALLLGSVAASVPGCKSGGSATADDAGGANSANAAGGDGSSGVDAVGGADSSEPARAGAPGRAGSPGSHAGSPGLGEAGASNSSPADALPTTTFLYVRSTTPDSDELVALDYVTGKARVVTDLRGDGSNGSEIWGHAISPDRRRIVLASLYGPTRADNDTGLATRRLWSLASDGSDLQRLTPVFENDGGGKSLYSIEVQDPVFTADGSSVVYDYGNWWYEGTSLKGGSLPWFVSAQGGLPEFLPTVSSCSVIEPSVNPATGDLLFVHSVCVNAADEGIFLYPSGGGHEPVKLVDRSFGESGVDPTLEKASWLADGSGFIFVGTIEVTRGTETDTANALLAYNMETGEVTVLLVPDAGTSVYNAAIAPNGDGIVYCLAHDDVYDLHAIDLTADPPVDAAISDDGVSCSPVF